MSDAVVLDASALLAPLGKKTGWERVHDALPSAAISTVNLAEVAGKLLERGATHDEVAALLDLGIESVPFDQSMAFAAAQLRPVTRPLGLSLGDRCCLATAWCPSRAVLTADISWRRTDVDGLDIQLLRR